MDTTNPEALYNHVGVTGTAEWATDEYWCRHHPNAIKTDQSNPGLKYKLMQIKSGLLLAKKLFKNFKENCAFYNISIKMQHERNPYI